MKLNLYGHSQNLSAALPVIERMRPPYWKAIDPDAGSAQRVAEDLGVRLIVRHYVDIGPAVAAAVDDPDAVASAFRDTCRAAPWYAYCWAVETHNEPMPFWDPRIAGYATFESRCVALFREDGKECLVNNLGSGNDGHFVAGASYYGCHDYGWPHLLSQAREHACRYRTWFGREVLRRNPQARLFVTECGVTAAVGTDLAPGTDYALGWQSNGRPARDYWDGSLLPYAHELARDPYVLGAFLFQVGANPEWASFDVEGTEIVDLLIEQQERSVMPLGPDLREQHQAQFDLWWNAGGWRNFASFLVATGQVTASPGEIRELVKDRLSSATQETTQFLNVLPL